MPDRISKYTRHRALPGYDYMRMRRKETARAEIMWREAFAKEGKQYNDLREWSVKDDRRK